jgi:hypothetical protein
LKLFFTVAAYHHRLPTVKIPCTFEIVIVNNMTSHVYRNMRLGFYRDYTITTSAIEKVLQGTNDGARQHLGTVAQNPTAFKKGLKGEDLEVGDAEKTINEHVVELEGI